MIEPRKKTIDGVVYEFRPLMLTPARTWANKLINKFGPAIGDGLSGLKVAGKVDMSADATAMLPHVAGPIGEFLKAACVSLQPEFYRDLCDTFLAQVTMYKDDRAVQLTAPAREMEFATALSLELRLVVWCLEEQYADFFGQLRKGIASAALLLTRQEASN